MSQGLLLSCYLDVTSTNILIKLQPRTRVLLNLKVYQLGWLKTKYSEFVKYVLTNDRQFNHNEVLYQYSKKNYTKQKMEIM